MSNSSEYEVWYDAHDGGRRHLRATSKDGVKEHISHLRAMDDQKLLLAQQFGFDVSPHEYNIEIRKVTTSVEPVEL